VSVLMNRGDGSFAQAVVYSAGQRPGDVVIADFNGDGKPDLATVNVPFFGGVPSDISLFPGNGDGTFGAATSIPVPGRSERIGAADLNGDGHPDLVTTDETNNTVTVSLGRGDGTFQAADSLPAGTGAFGFRITDLDGD